MEKETITKKSSKGEQTKEKLAERFISLMSQKRWDKITVKEICSAAGITRGTYYQYFDDIYDLMEQIQNNLLDDLSEKYRKVSSCRRAEDKSLSGGINDTFCWEVPPQFEAWLEFCMEHKDAMLALTNDEKGNPYFKKKLQDIVVSNLDIMMDQDGLPRDALRPHFQQLYFAMHFHTMYIWLSSNNTNISTKRMAQVLNTMRIGASYLYYQERKMSTEVQPMENNPGKED